METAASPIHHWEAIGYMSSILSPSWEKDVGPGKRERHPDVRQLKIIIETSELRI